MSYERAGRRESAIQYYDRHAAQAARFTGTPRPGHTAAQSRAAAERLRQQIAQERPEDDVIEDIWSWVTGRQEEAPAPGEPAGRETTPTGKGFIGQTVDNIASAFGAGAAKVATDTARQTGALERGAPSREEAPVVTMPEGGRVSLPGWFPYAIMGAVGLSGVALVAWYMKSKSEEE
jgi:hypothetical protein